MAREGGGWSERLGSPLDVIIITIPFREDCNVMNKADDRRIGPRFLGIFHASTRMLVRSPVQLVGREYFGLSRRVGIESVRSLIYNYNQSAHSFLISSLSWYSPAFSGAG